MNNCVTGCIYVEVFMDKRKIAEFVDFIRDPKNKKYVNYMKYAVTALIVVIALVFFGSNGKKSDNFPVEELNKQIIETETETVNDLKENNDAADDTSHEEIYVDIEGLVNKPGVYKVKADTRMFEVIELAGGLLAGADVSQINQAETLYDGEKITIYEQGTLISDDIVSDRNNLNQNNSTDYITSDGLININNADSNGLQEIPGVGPATAEKIINYRETNGRFSSIEEIKNVNGIGDKTFEKIKDMITV